MKLRPITLFTAAMLTAFTLTTAQAADNGLRPERLRVEALVNPLGIDAQPPALSWIVAADGRDARQSAYRVLVASTPEKLAANEGDLWDSGKVASEQTLHVSYAGKALASGQFAYWKVMVWDGQDKPSAWSEPAFWSMGLLAPGDWKGKWISDENALRPCPLPPLPSLTRKGGDEWEWKPAKHGIEREVVRDPSRTSPWLRKSFHLTEKPMRAVATIASVGYHELYGNGKKAGDDILSPPVTRLDKRAIYVTRDITDLLHVGENTIGLWLGQGWAANPKAMLEHGAAARGQISISFNGGETLTLATDETWKTHPGPITFIGSCVYRDLGGERYEARLDAPEWSSPEFDDSDWQAASIIPVRPLALSALNCQPDRITESFPAVFVEPFASNFWSHPGYRIDMGRAYTGWLRLRLSGKPGQLVTLTYSEYEDGRQIGTQYDEVILDAEGEAEFCNRFNYRSFQWVFVTGLDEAPKPEDATALVMHTDFPIVTEFSCSNELLTRISDTMAWTFRAVTSAGVVTDCQHRERGGYGVEGGVSADFGMTRFDLQAMLAKWLRDWRDAQSPDGYLPVGAPYDWGAGFWPIWGLQPTALAPWLHYLRYADDRVLAEIYPVIQAFLEYVRALAVEGGLTLDKSQPGRFTLLGDWASALPGTDGNQIDDRKVKEGAASWPVREREMFVNGFIIVALDHAADIAGRLGKPKDAAAFRRRAEAMRKSVHVRYYDAEGGFYVRDEQPFHAIALMAGVPPDEATRKRILENLERNILVTRKGHNWSGVAGSYVLFKQLEAEGRGDLIHTMLTRTEYPSWGHMLDRGATTFWEYWDGTASRIHSSYIAVPWFVDGLAGIKPDPAHPGYKHFSIDPAIVGDVTWVKCAYDSVRGKIVSNWKLADGKLTMEITVPANTTATVHVPTPEPASVREGGVPVAKAPGIRKVEARNGEAVIEAGSGSYIFTAKAPAPRVAL